VYITVTTSLTSIISYNLHHCLIEKNIINIISFTSLPQELLYVPHEADLDHTTRIKCIQHMATMETSNTASPG
jgi:hypothetical protein